MKLLRPAFFFAVLTLFFVQLEAQELPNEQFTVENGLSNSIVYRAYNDSKGYMWFSTDYGLSRFDGHDFKNFHSASGLRSDYIMSVCEGDSSRFLVCSFGKGVDLLNIYTEHACRLEGLPTDPLYIERDHSIFWILNAKSELFAYDPIKKSAQPFPLSKPKEYIIGISGSANNGTAVLSSQYIYFLEKGSVVKQVDIRGGTALSCDRDGVVWVFKKDSLLEFKGMKMVGERKLFSVPKAATAFRAVNANMAWISTTDDSLFLIDPSAGTLLKRYGFDVRINDICMDQQGNTWLATYGKGVLRIKTISIQNFNSSNGLSGNIINGIWEEENGKIWVTANNGINYFEKGIPHPYIYFDQSALERSSIVMDEKKNIIIPDFTKLKIYTGTKQTGVVDMPSKVLNLLKGSDGSLWAATRNGIERSAKGNIRNFSPLTETSGHIIYCMFEDHNGSFWFGSDSLVFHYENEKLERYDQKNGVPVAPVYGISSDRAGNIWLATGRGAYVIREGKPVVMNKLESLQQLKCNCIVHDHQRDIIWLGTQYGLYAYDGTTVKRSDQRAGLAGDEIHSLYITTDEKLLVGTVNGMSEIDLKHFLADDVSYDVPVFITSVLMNGAQLNDTADIHLSYNSNIKINFTGIDFKNKKITYWYRLEGYTNEWISTTNQSVEFNALAPGNYRLFINAKNGSQGPVAELDFSVERPFWQKWSFIFMLIVLGIIAATLLFRWRLSVYKRKELEKLEAHKKLVTLEHRALSALMNPHFIFNVLNSIQYYMKYVSMEKANDYLKKFTALIRQNFDNVQSNFNTLAKELEALDLYLTLEKIRFEDKMEYTITVDTSIDAEQVMIPSMLIQPYAENAIWHGLMPKDGNGKVTIRIVDGTDHIMIYITDNGIGIHSSVKKEGHRSSALLLTKERLDILSKLVGKNASIKITDIGELNPPETGTEVAISLPKIPPGTVI